MWRYGSAAVALAMVLVPPRDTRAADGRAPFLTDSVIVAASDLAKLPPAYHPYTRYLDLSAVTVPKEWAQGLSFHSNQLSRGPTIKPPVLVNNLVLRLDVRWYRWKAELWEKLAPVYPYGAIRAKRKMLREDIEVERDVVAVAPWLGETPESKKAVAYLVQQTHSSVPIVRGDWFLWQTIVAVERDANNPGYYQFLGIKNQKGFEDLIGFDPKASEDFTRSLLSVVANSGVARQPRRIERFQKIGGGYWKTYDNITATGANNPIRLINGGFDAEAIEAFGHLPCGLWAMGLFQFKTGNLQNSAPDFVGHDRTSTSNDGRIIAPLSCIRCHVNAGLQPIRRLTIQKIDSVDYDLLERLQDQYFRALQPFIRRDRERHAEAVFECNGLTPQKNAKLVAKLWEEYADTPVTVERAARECGLTSAAFLGKLKAYRDKTGNLDAVLSMFLAPEDEREGVPIDQWHEVFPLAILATRGYVLPAEVVQK